MRTQAKWVAAGMAATMICHALPAGADGLPTSSLERWKLEARASLKRALLDPRPLGRPSEPVGVTDIQFAMDGNGRTVNVSVLHPSGYRTLDRKALSAVRRMRTRSETPSELAGGRLVLARVFVTPADGPFDEKAMDKMLARTVRQNGWKDRDRLARAGGDPILLAASR